MMFLKVAIALSCVYGGVQGKSVDDKHESVIAQEFRHHEGGHNPDVDHEAFLGKDHGHDFDELSPEESKSKLSALLPKVDLNSDGDIDQEELEKWIKVQVNEYINRDTERAMPHDDTNMDGMLSWNEYVTNTYGEQYLDESKLSEEDDDDNYILYVKRDKTRFDLADQDQDASLNFEEFKAFLHPEEFRHMADAVVEETLEDMDEDHDGKISLSEYIGDMIDDEDDEDSEDKEWVSSEKKSFQEIKDKNGDGYLDKEELAAWVIPSESDFSVQEAKHLIEKADNNKDGILSFDEIVDNYDVFVGSQATDYGRILHEEL